MKYSLLKYFMLSQVFAGFVTVFPECMKNASILFAPWRPFCVISNQDYKCVLDFYNWFPFNEAIYCFHNFAHGMRQLKLVWTLASNFIGYKAPFNRNWTIGIL